LKYLLLGAGLQGTAIAFDLLQHAAGTTRLTVVDRDAASLERLRARLESDARLVTKVCDVTDSRALAPLMAGADVVISAVNYWFNAPLARLAVEQRSHFLDLGGNNDVVARELSLDAQARARGVTVIPDCGLAPGMAGILAYDLHGTFEEVQDLRIRVGGLPRHPRPPLNYMLLFAVQGLINEYVEPCLVVRDGELRSVPGLSELETVRFPEPWGELEAFQTSGGISTLPQTLRGRVRNLDYKTIRYRGHCDKFRLLLELGLCAEEPVRLRDVEFAPREFLGLVLEKALSFPDEDVTLVLIEAVGTADGRPCRRALRIVDTYDHAHGISSMMRTTGFPAAIIAAMLAGGEIAGPGARPQELVVPARRFITELDRRGITLQREEEPLAREAGR
jgi:lysine 6-dehydrogenase